MNLPGVSMSWGGRAVHIATRLGRAIRRTASGGRPPGARRTEDPALFRPLVYGDPDRLHIAPTAVVNNALFNLSSGEVTIGAHAVVGVGALVLRDVEPYTVVAGNPARVLRHIPRGTEAEDADPDSGGAGAVTAG